MLIQELINTIVQTAFALTLAGGFWFVLARKRAGFRDWIGLASPPARWWIGALVCFALVSLVSAPLLAFGPFAEIASGAGTVGGQFAKQGLSASVLATIALVAMIKTALTEEIVFRGLIGKRLIGRFGFAAGNTIQALLFGAIHLFIFAADGAPEPTLAAVSMVVGLPGFAGWMMGFANHRFGGDTIWPGWLIHAAGNFISYILMATALA